MNEVKQLPRGIPQGYTPQRQRASESATVLVAEWARKAAHELNDRHHNWIEARSRDEFSEENLSESQVRETLDHAALLMRWELIEEYLPKVQRDHDMIYAYISHLRRTKGYVGRRRVTKQQWSAHLLSQQEELAYKVFLLRVLKRRLGEYRYTANSAVTHITDKIESDFLAASVAYEVLRAVLARLGRDFELTEDERKAIKGFRYYMKESRKDALKRGELCAEGDPESKWKDWGLQP